MGNLEFENLEGIVNNLQHIDPETAGLAALGIKETFFGNTGMFCIGNARGAQRIKALRLLVGSAEKINTFMLGDRNRSQQLITEEIEKAQNKLKFPQRLVNLYTGVSPHAFEHAYNEGRHTFASLIVSSTRVKGRDSIWVGYPESFVNFMSPFTKTEEQAQDFALYLSTFLLKNTPFK